MATIRIIAELVYSDANGKIMQSATGFFADFARVNFSHMAIIMFLCCVVICVVVSLLTPRPVYENIRGLTFGTLTPEQKLATRNSYTTSDIIVSAILVLIVLSVLIYFRG